MTGKVGLQNVNHRRESNTLRQHPSMTRRPSGQGIRSRMEGLQHPIQRPDEPGECVAVAAFL